VTCIPELKNIDIIRGQALDIEVTVPDGADLSGATATFGIAETPESAYVVNLTTSKSGQVITAVLTETKSLLLTRRQHYYSCWVIIGGDPTPVARGYINVSNDPRNR
jgi:hypothetical protein